MPKFSIIIPCYNAALTIDETLASIQAQSWSDWEAICIDDGSTDKTCAVVSAAIGRDSRITLHRNPRKGPSAARNYGALALAKGDMIAFCDADDLWTSTKLTELAETFADPAIDGVFGEIAFFSHMPGDTQVRSTAPSAPLSIETLLGENPVCTMSNVAVRKATFVQSTGLDETMVHNEDLDWLIRLVGSGARVIGLPMLQTYYRRSAGGLSADLNAMDKGRQQALASAARLGIRPTAAAHAIYHRYLARRALRLGLGRTTALRHAAMGLVQSPQGFLLPLHRGVPTLAAAACASLMPATLTRRLFA